MKFRKNNWMTAVGICILFSAGILTLSSFQARRATEDIWKMLGMTRQAGTEQIRNSFFYGYLSYYGAKNAKNLALNDRQAVATDLMNFTKTYVSSPEFNSQYEKMRKDLKPMEPEAKPVRTKEQVQKEEIAKTEKSLRDMEKSIKEMGPDMAKALQSTVDMQKKTLKEYQNPNHQYFQMMVQNDIYEKESREKRYKEDMARWEKSYPASVKVYVADKLEKMLEYTSNIDYNAELVEKYGKKRFVKPEYEGKRTEWKQGYRAGKAVTESAREFVKKWLAELK